MQFPGGSNKARTKHARQSAVAMAVRSGGSTTKDGKSTGASASAIALVCAPAISLISLSLAVLSGVCPSHAQSLQNMPGQRYGITQGATPGTLTPSQSGSLGANIWNSIGNSRVPVGTLLSGILEDDLHSGKSQRGDVFSIRLEDGYFKNGVEVLPRHSRILGAITNVIPSKLTGHGHPGNLQVTLQTIVFPDGRNTPLYGFIVHNPNMDETQNPRKTSVAQAANYYPKAAVNSLGMVGRTISGRLIGFKPGFRQRGADFQLEKGEILAVRLNRPLDLTHMSPAPTGFAPSNLPQYTNTPTVQGLTSGQPLAPPAAVPGSMPPAAPQLGAGQNNQSNPVPGLTPQNSTASPNQIFEKPVGPKPGLSMPDPF